MKPNKAAVALLEVLLEAAREGELQDLFAVFLCADGSYDSVFDTNDLDDMLLQVRTEVIRARTVAEIIHDDDEDEQPQARH